MVARREAGGAEPRTLLTDCPGAVSEDGRDESRTHQHTCPELYRQLTAWQYKDPDANGDCKTVLLPA